MAVQRYGGARGGGGCFRKCRWLVKAVVSRSSSFVLQRGLRMSVVHGLTAGWLVDHLSFINRCGYEICDSFAHPGGVTHSTSVTSTEDSYSISTSAAMPSSSDGPPFDPGDAIEAEGRRAKMRYVFWEEFLDISKPYIAAACEEQLCPTLRKMKTTVSRTLAEEFIAFLVSENVNLNGAKNIDLLGRGQEKTKQKNTKDPKKDV